MRASDRGVARAETWSGGCLSRVGAVSVPEWTFRPDTDAKPFEPDPAGRRLFPPPTHGDDGTAWMHRSGNASGGAESSMMRGGFVNAPPTYRRERVREGPLDYEHRCAEHETKGKRA